MKYSEMKKILPNRLKDCIRFLNDGTERGGEREREAGREGETERIRETERERKKERRVAFAFSPVYVMM